MLAVGILIASILQIFLIPSPSRSFNQLTKTEMIAGKVPVTIVSPQTVVEDRPFLIALSAPPEYTLTVSDIAGGGIRLGHVGLNSSSAQIYLTSTQDGNQQISFNVSLLGTATSGPSIHDTRNVNIEFFANPSVSRRAVFIVFVGLIIGALVSWLRERLQKTRQNQARIEEKIEQAESKAQAEPARAKFAWDLARVKLEAYFDRNLAQVNQVFWCAMCVMVVGFGFVLWGVRLSIAHEARTAWVAGASGIITQFIGATFMLIYRSTMSQANQFMSVLERINTVGMAVQMLDAIPDAETQLKNETRTRMVELLLGTSTNSKHHSKTAKATASTL